MNTAHRSRRDGTAPSTPRRSLIFLGLMTIIAICLIFIPKPAKYYPHIQFYVPSEIELEFVLQPKLDETTCLSAANTINNAVVATCQTCQTRVVRCLKNPSSEILELFGENPLGVPSTRTSDTIILFKSSSVESAKLACSESERQLSQHEKKIDAKCYLAGTHRPKTALEQNKNTKNFNTFTIALAITGALLAATVFNILLTYFACRAIPAIKNNKTISPWVEKFSLAGTDSVILLSTFLCLAWPTADDVQHWSAFDRNIVTGYIIIVIITICWFWIFLEHYARRRPFWDELRETIKVAGTMTLISSTAALIAGIDTGRFSYMMVWLINLILLPLGRTGIRHILDDLGLWRRPAIIVGTGENAKEAWLAIKNEHSMGYQLYGFVKTEQCENELDEITIGCESYRIYDPNIIDGSNENFQIIFAAESLTEDDSQALLNKLLQFNQDIHLIPPLRGLPLFGTKLSHFFSHEVLLLTFQNNLNRRSYRWIKRLFDLLAASVLIILLSPLFIYISLQIRKDGGPAFYGHQRIGKNGRKFMCLKFRSMHKDSDKLLSDLLKTDPLAMAEWNKDFKLRNDPRVTPIGKFLRKTSLDELPQLINVLAGSMSLVGPRPIILEELGRYGDRANLYLQVLPGMTGLWQVSGRNDTNYNQRVALDAWYVKNWSLWYDIAILFKTVTVVVNQRGAY